MSEETVKTTKTRMKELLEKELLLDSLYSNGIEDTEEYKKAKEMYKDQEDSISASLSWMKSVEKFI
jgi:hypothetical protein